MQLELALHGHDISNGEVSTAQWLSFIVSAVRDCRSSGWLIRLEDDESITVTATAYEYNVPSGFAYVEKLLIEETIQSTAVYVREIPKGHWEIRLNGSVPVFTFGTITELTPGRTIKVIGQKRPTIYTAANETIDAGMEGFLRERALYFGFRYMGAGISELARWRQQMSIQAFNSSEAMLGRHPQEFRSLPASEEVPGRG